MQPGLQEAYYGFGNASLRVNAIAVHPTDPNTVYLGTSFGGVAKSTDGGTDWNYVTDGLPSQEISSVIIDPVSPNIVYAGTGDPYYNVSGHVGSNGGRGVSLFGVGIYRSTDSGKTWQNFGQSTLGGAVVRRLALDTTTAGSQTGTTLFSAVSNGGNPGIWKSADSGQTWTLQKSGTAFDVTIDPMNRNTIYTVFDSGVFKSADGGTTWSSVHANPSSSKGRLAMVGSTLYVSLCDQDPILKQTGKLFMSADGENNWIEIDAADGLIGAQCDYDNYVAIDPAHSNNIFLGGVDAYRSSNGGTSFTDYSNYNQVPNMVTHSDHHDLAFAPSNTAVLYEGNDGGVFKSLDGGQTWTSKNNNLPGALIIGIGVSGDGHMAMGAQDNGTNQYSGSNAKWVEWNLGDGGYAKIDAGNSQIMYGTYVVGSSGLSAGTIVRSGNGGADTNPADITPAGAIGESSLFYPTFFMKPEDSSRLILGFQYLWRSIDSGTSWTQIGTLHTTGGAGTGFSAVYEAPSNVNTIYASVANTLWSTNDAEDGTNALWTEVDNGLPTSQWITAIAVHPQDPKTVYVTLSQYGTATAPESHIFKSTNGGTSWSNISSGLPDAPFNTIVIDTASPNNIFAGSDVGVFNSIDGGASWTQSNLGIPQGEIINSLSLNSGTRQLVAGTYGRGAYSLALPPVPSIPTGLGGTAQGASSISWTWDASPAQYNVQAYGLYQEATPTVLVASVTSPTYVWTGLTPNTSYTLQVTAANGILESANSASKVVSTLAAAPTPLSFTNQTATGFTVNFTNGSNGPGTLFIAQISADPTVAFSPVVSSSQTANTFASFSGLTPNTQYFFRAGAISNNGTVVFSANSQTLGISTYTAPSVPTAATPVADNVAATSLRFHWNSSSNGSGVTFNAQTSTDPLFGSGVQTVSQTASTYADFTGLSPNTTYYLRAQSVGQNGSSVFVNLGSTSTLANAPSSPMASAVYLSSITFAWNANGNGPGTLFVAQISADPTTAFSPVVGSSQTANAFASFSGLSANTTYYLRVNSLNNNSIPSTYVTASSSTLATAPTAAAKSFLEVDFTSATVAWTALPSSPQSSTAEGYLVQFATSSDFSTIAGSSSTAAGTASASITGLNYGTTYYARVGSLNWEGLANYLSLGSTTTATPPLASGTVTSSGLCLTMPPAFAGISSISACVPSGAFPVGTTVSIAATIGANLASARSNEASAITAFGPTISVDLNAGGLQPTSPVLITIAYDPTKIPAGFNERQLQLMRYDTAAAQWTLVPSQVDPVGHVLTANVSHFSTFAPFLVAAASDVSSVQVFPQPWEIGDASSQYWSGVLTFSNLPANATIKIFAITGELVASATTSAAGTTTWDGRNRFGKRAASGTYYAVIQNGSQTKTRRFVIIR